MKEIKSFDRPTVKKIHEEFDSMMRDFAKKYGLEFEGCAARFSECELTLKGNLKYVGEIGHTSEELRDAAFFLKFSDLKNKPAELFGSRWKINGAVYECIGYKSSCRTYPLLMKKVSTGQVYKFTTASLATATLMK